MLVGKGTFGINAHFVPFLARHVIPFEFCTKAVFVSVQHTKHLGKICFEKFFLF